MASWGQIATQCPHRMQISADPWTGTGTASLDGISNTYVGQAATQKPSFLHFSSSMKICVILIPSSALFYYRRYDEKNLRLDHGLKRRDWPAF
jgi:hypothetical protein